MLTPEQIQERKKGIGSSDATRIANGEWYDLWREKTGRFEPGAILTPWDALLRHHIEPVLMDFYEVTYGAVVSRRAEAVICKDYPILRATLDGFDAGEPRVIDAKLLNNFTPGDPRDWAAEKYGWQMIHQMLCTGVDKGSLYISVGMAKPLRLDWELNEFQALSYVDRCKEFWTFVETDQPPPDAPPEELPPTPIDEMRVVDMTQHKKANEWGNFAADWLAHGDAAEKFKKAVDGLKKMVDKDVRLATGNGIEISRDGRGLSIKKGAAK